MRLNNKGYAITTFMYSILLLFLLIISLTIINLINSRLTLDKLKKEVKNKIEERYISSYNDIRIVSEDIEIKRGLPFDLLSDVNLKDQKDNIIYTTITYTSTPQFDSNTVGSYLIVYETTYKNKEYINSRIIKVVD